MSGECDKCNEHTLECSCETVCRSKEGAFQNYRRSPDTEFIRISADGTNFYKEHKNMEWISVKDRLPPKEEKFLFHYEYGTGLGNWDVKYKDINNNSEYVGECYHLVLWASEVNSNSRCSHVMEFNEETMIQLDFFWMPLPNPPKE